MEAANAVCAATANMPIQRRYHISRAAVRSLGGACSAQCFASARTNPSNCGDHLPPTSSPAVRKRHRLERTMYAYVPSSL
eukprot:16444438-Heterocapsa_arctica.AAC.1